MFKKLTQIRNNVLISRRLKGLVVVIALLILVLGFISIRSVSNINNKINEINEVYLKSLIKLSVLVENIYSVLIESHIIDEKSLSENTIDNSLNVDLLSTYLTDYEQSIVDDAQRSLYNNFIIELQNYLSILKEVNSLEFQGKMRLAAEIKAVQEISSFKKLQSIIKSMVDYNSEGIRNNSIVINQLEKKALSQIYLVSSLILLLSILITLFLIKDINISIKSLVSNLGILQKGEIPKDSVVESKNELGQMARLTNDITKNLSELNHFANDISKGNYSSEYQFVGKDDLLGKALVNLRNSLRVSKEEDEKRKIEEERRNWTNKGHAIFGEILRQRSRGVNQLTDDIIKNLVYYLQANQGGLFLVNDSEDVAKIELISAFAYDRKKFLDRTINIGDGLIGTVALERNTIYLKEIPEDYIEIESGLGDAVPNCLLIVPLKFEDDILGIVEIASFKEFQEYEIKFIEEAAQSIASTLLTAKINARTEQLLEDSRKQSEELTAQEIEARQNMEEMRAAQELAERREADLTGILSAVDNTLMKGEYELDGTLISVNNRHLQTMGYQLKEIKGKNIEMFIPKDELEQFRKVWASVVAGNSRQLEVRRRTKTGEILWLINQYTPVTDISGKISKVLYLAHDISVYKQDEEDSISGSRVVGNKGRDIKKKSVQLEEVQKEITVRNNEINSILRGIELDQTMVEFDLDGKLIKVNSVFEELFNLKFAEIAEKKFIELVKIEESTKDFNAILDELKAGNIFSSDNLYKLKDGARLCLRENYVPVYDAENKIERILSIGNNITELKLAEKKNDELIKEKNDAVKSLENKENEMHEAIQGFLKKGSLPKEYGEVIEVLNQSIPRIDIDLSKNFVFVNKCFLSEFKYSSRELKDQPIDKIIATKNKEEFKKELKKAIEGKLETFETKLVSKNKEQRDVKLVFIPVREDDKEISKLIIYIIVQSDIDQKEATGKDIKEEISKKKKELEEINASIEKLKSKTGTYLESDADELYNKWLNKLKEDN